MKHTPSEMAELTDPGRGSIAFGLVLGSPPDWFRVHARCEAPFGTWAFQDECLQADEVVALIGWLDGICDTAEQTTPDARLAEFPSHLDELSFLEPELRFQLVAAGGGWVRLRIGVTWNTAPPTGGKYDFIESGPLWMDLCVPVAQVRRLSRTLHEQMRSSLRGFGDKQ